MHLLLLQPPVGAPKAVPDTDSGSPGWGLRLSCRANVGPPCPGPLKDCPCLQDPGRSNPSWPALSTSVSAPHGAGLVPHSWRPLPRRSQGSCWQAPLPCFCEMCGYRQGALLAASDSHTLGRRINLHQPHVGPGAVLSAVHRNQASLRGPHSLSRCFSGHSLCSQGSEPARSL